MKNLTTIKEVTEKCTLIKDAEDDLQAYVEELNKVRKQYPQQQFYEVADLGDVIIRRLGNYYTLNDCGIQSLWKLKEDQMITELPNNQSLVKTINENTSTIHNEGMYYFTEEQVFLLIAGYVDNSSNVDNIVKTLTEYKEYIQKLVKTDAVNTWFIDKSSRYKNMRAFFCKTEDIPKDTYIIEGNNWTMCKWLYN